MSPRRMIAAMPIALWLLAPLGWSGCTERPEGEGQAKASAAPDAGALALEDAGTDRGDEVVGWHTEPWIAPEWIVKTGKLDSRDRYSAAVMVSAHQDQGPNVTVCTGVLVSPHLALTAANCVCPPPKEEAESDGGQRVIDGKACVPTAEADVCIQDPRACSTLPNKELVYEGPVRVHPAFKEVIDGQGNIVSSEADLAVIRLDRAAKVAPVELADSDVKPGESLVVVGYGYPGEPYSYDEERRFSEHPVTKVLNSGGRMAFVQPAPFIFKGARGGPCLRRTSQGMRLAGIFSTTDGKKASFTSIYPYRDWLRAEMEGATDGGIATPPGSR